MIQEVEMISVILLLVSYIPAVLLYIYLRNVRKEDKEFGTNCSKLLLMGALCSVGVFLVSLVFTLVFRFSGLYSVSPLLSAFLKSFFVFAFSEEFIKQRAVKKMVSKYDSKVSWLMMIAFGGIVGLGFHLLESAVYALTTNSIQIIVRGITVGHAAYGMLMGYYMGKAMITGDKADSVKALLYPILLHGMYDFSLAEEFGALNDNLVFVPFIILGVNFWVLIRLILLMKKEQNNPEYASVIGETEEEKIPVSPEEQTEETEA